MGEGWRLVSASALRPHLPQSHASLIHIQFLKGIPSAAILQELQSDRKGCTPELSINPGVQSQLYSFL